MRHYLDMLRALFLLGLNFLQPGYALCQHHRRVAQIFYLVKAFAEKIAEYTNFRNAQKSASVEFVFGSSCRRKTPHIFSIWHALWDIAGRASFSS